MNIRCPFCNSFLTVPDNYVGIGINCAECHNTYIVSKDFIVPNLENAIKKERIKNTNKMLKNMKTEDKIFILMNTLNTQLRYIKFSSLALCFFTLILLVLSIISFVVFS